MSIVKFNNKIIKFNTKTVGWTAPVPPPVLYHVTTNGINGIVVATPNTGYNGDTITLSNTPDEGYEFDSYSLTGATLYDTNKFDINNSDVNVVGNFIASGPSFDEVTIGTQTWMAKNLAIDDGGEGIYTQTVNYGRGSVTEYYYTWDAAKRIANSISGWHLPTKDEWNTLANSVGGISTAGTKLKSTYGWSSGNGDDIYGFGIFPAGSWYSDHFGDLFENAYFWTSTQQSYYNVYYSYFYYGQQMQFHDYYKKTYANSVRLIKDT